MARWSSGWNRSATSNTANKEVRPGLEIEKLPVARHHLRGQSQREPRNLRPR
jgi:hypothetical protein